MSKINTDEIREEIRINVHDRVWYEATLRYILGEIDRLEKVWEDTDDRARGLEAEVVRLRVKLKECGETIQRQYENLLAAKGFEKLYHDVEHRTKEAVWESLQEWIDENTGCTMRIERNALRQDIFSAGGNDGHR